jgi:hypothetical protein
MSTYWLRDQLRGNSKVVLDGGNPILSVTFDGRTERIYSPDPDEYRVTADVVLKAQKLGATVIAYGSWCEATYDGKEYAKKHGIAVMSYASFFAYLKRHGVILGK